MAKKVTLALEGFSRSEEEAKGKSYVAMAWYATDGSGSTIRKSTGLHDTLAEAYAEAKKLLNIPSESLVCDSYGDWPY